MKKDAVWQAFAETGDPVYYLLYKATQTEQSKGKKNSSGQPPRN